MYMKILLISSRFFPFKGGVENVVEHLYNKFSKNNEVYLLTTQVNTDTSESDSKYKIKRIWLGVPSSLKGFLAFPIRFVRSCVELLNYVSEINPDIINYHFLDDSVLYVGILRIFNRKSKLIVNIHGNDLHIFSKKFYLRFFMKRVLNDASKIIVNSNYMREELIASHLFGDSKKIIVIANGFEILEDKSLGSDFSKPEYQYIFCVGRMVYKKGIDLLIEAFSKLNAPSLHLIIEGKGDELENIKALIIAKNLSDRVHLKEGSCSDSEKLFLMRNALFGVIPSRIEPFGIVALEYLYTETPLISSRTGGLVDILKDEYSALFFKNENIDDLVIKMNELINNDELRQKITKSNKEILKGYDWNTISKKYLDCFNN